MRRGHSTYLGRVGLGKPRAFLNLVLGVKAQGGEQWAWEVCSVENWYTWLVPILLSLFILGAVCLMSCVHDA